MRGAKTLLNASLALLAGMGVLVSAGPAAADAPAPAAPATLFPVLAIASNHVRDVRVHPSDGGAGGTEIEIEGTGAPTYNVRVADGGRRLLVDLSDSDVAGAPAAITAPVGVVGGILTQGFDTRGRAHDPPLDQPDACRELSRDPARNLAARGAHAERALGKDHGGGRPRADAGSDHSERPGA